MDIALQVAGRSYTGWTSVRIDRSLDQFVSTFDFDYSDQWAESTEPRQLLLGSACVAQVDSETVLTGWIDQTRLSVSGSSIQGTAQGRSKTGDLVDCSAVHKTGQWRQQLSKTIIADLTRPFGIAVSYDPQIVDTIKVPRFDLEYGETVFEAIDRLARLRSMLPVSLPDGSLRFIRISRTSGLRTVQLDLRECTTREYSNGQQDRFATYRIAAQTARSSADESPRRAALEKFQVTDPNVTRYRPMVVRSEIGAKQVELQAHATWIMNQRAAQAERLSYTVVGVRAPDRKLWEPGMLVGVDDRQLSVNDVFVVAAIAFIANNQTLETRLDLARIEAYGAEPISEKQLINKLKRL